MTKPVARREALKLGFLATAGLRLDGLGGTRPRPAPPSDPDLQAGGMVERRYTVAGSRGGTSRP